MNNSDLTKKIFARLFVFIGFMLVIFFVPAGTLAYWEAWVYLILILIFMFCFTIYFLKNDPELLERRMRTKEKETQQKWIIKFLFLSCLFTVLLPGFDKRLEWSNVPVVLVIFADIFVVLGYFIVFLTMRENSYASRIIEVEKGQEVISTGPYAIIRHPMYLGSTLMFLLTPLALGSYWAIIPAVFIIPILMARILNEEQILERELEGYQEYMKKIRFRFIPGIW